MTLMKLKLDFLYIDKHFFYLHRIFLTFILLVFLTNVLCFYTILERICFVKFVKTITLGLSNYCLTRNYCFRKEI